jgi:hypothetical protein
LARCPRASGARRARAPRVRWRHGHSIGRPALPRFLGCWFVAEASAARRPHRRAGREAPMIIRLQLAAGSCINRG